MYIHIPSNPKTFVSFALFPAISPFTFFLPESPSNQTCVTGLRVSWAVEQSPGSWSGPTLTCVTLSVGNAQLSNPSCKRSAIKIANSTNADVGIPALHTLIFHHFFQISVYVQCTLTSNYMVPATLHLHTTYAQPQTLAWICSLLSGKHHWCLQSHPSIDTNHKNDSRIISKPHVPVLNSDLPAESPKIWKVAPKR